jgi:hypothetical protein
MYMSSYYAPPLLVAAPPRAQVSPISQGSQHEQSSRDIFADIPHVQGHFVHNLYQSGNLIPQAIYGLRLFVFGYKYTAKLGAADAVTPR